MANSFPILHLPCEHWVLGDILIGNGTKCIFLNVMYGLTQFTISSLLSEKKTSILLANIFMENVILTFGMVVLVVVDSKGMFLKTLQ